MVYPEAEIDDMNLASDTFGDMSVPSLPLCRHLPQPAVRPNKCISTTAMGSASHSALVTS